MRSTVRELLPEAVVALGLGVVAAVLCHFLVDVTWRGLFAGAG